MVNEQIAKRLRVERAAKGWSISEAAKRCGVQRDTLSALEHAKRGVYSSTLEKIAEGYGVPVNVLLGGSVIMAGEPTARWVLTATPQEYAVWLDHAERGELHKMFSKTIPAAADNLDDEELLEVARQRAGAAVDKFFDLAGIGRVIFHDRPSRPEQTEHPEHTEQQGVS